MINLKEFKEMRNLEKLQWMLEELREFINEKNECTITNLIGVLEYDIKNFDKIMYYLWVYYKKEDRWVKAVGSYNQDNLVGDIKWLKDRNNDITKYIILQENILGKSDEFPNEVIMVLLNNLLQEKVDIKEVV